jgi:flagellar L-ring protein precursor FlgH
MKKWYLALIILGILQVHAVKADSLFDPRGVCLFRDHRAHDVGDIVTIVVVESTNATNEGSSEFEKKVGMKGGIRVEGFLDYVFPGWFEPMEPLKALDIDPQGDYSGTGKTSSGNTFATKITATVIDRLPNGNLVIEGTRNIKVNEEKQELVLRGVVRPQDISPSNMILSTQIADVEMFYKGKGPVGNHNKPGLLTRMFSWIF